MMTDMRGGRAKQRGIAMLFRARSLRGANFFAIGMVPV
jgi:hypothetical protein